MKKKLALICAMVMLLMSFAQTVGAINVIMNSSFVTFSDQEPVIQDGVTLVPLRTIAELLGLEVGWDDPTDTVTLKKDNFYIELVIGSTTAKTSSGTKTIAVAPCIINSRTMVPLRFIAEELGLKVSWNETYKRVVINGQVDTTVVPVVEKPTDETVEVTEDSTDMSETVDEVEELSTDEEFQDDIALTTIEGASSAIVLEIPPSFVGEDTEDGESFAARSIDAFDAQHTYNWERVSRYESYVDESGTSGMVFIVQEYESYDGEEYDIGRMNDEYPTPPEAPEINWGELTREVERLVIERLCAEREVEMPENYEDMEDEEMAEYLGFESVEDMSSYMEGIDTSEILYEIPEYVDYMNYREENKIYREEYNELKKIKDYAYRKFPEVYQNASDEEWATFFTTYFNTDEEVRYEGVEILDINGKKVVHSVIYAEDPDDEQGVYEYYQYMDGDCLITIFGGTLFGSEPAGAVVDVLSDMSIN